MASDRYPHCFKVSSFFGQLVGQTVCWIFVEELVRSVLNKRRHRSLVGVGIHDYTRVPFVCWENHDGSSFRLLSASHISFVMLGSVSSACWRIPWTALLTVSACLVLSCLMGASTLVMISDKDRNAISQQECDLSARIKRHQLELLKKKTTTNHIRASCFIRSCMTSRPHRLKKTSSMQLKCHMWLHHETNEKLSFYCYSPGWITTIFYL